MMFENDNEHDFNLVMDMHTKLNDLSIRIRQRAELILDVEQQGYSAEVFESVKLLKDLQETDNAKARSLKYGCALIKQVFVDVAHYDMPLVYNVEGCFLHFGRPEFSLITGLHFGSFSFRKFKSGDVTFVSRVLPHNLGLKVTNLDLLGLIEDEELFGKLVDDDVVCVCLLLALEGSPVNLDLTPTISKQQTVWYMAFRKFFMSYIPRTPPTTYTDLFDDYIKKLSASRKRGKIDTRDLSIIRRCDTTIVEEIRLKDGVIAKLNSQVFKLEAIIKVHGREQKGVSLVRYESAILYF
uniref:Phospholipase-like protein n=1 Tax=Tanacetum cinerariifolium TaxID=118510 RepID=A0A699J0T2_TANCI|nr:phospholipase-like protein [Tanacetum cinerariifolium]